MASDKYTAYNPPAGQILLADPKFRQMWMSSYAEATRSGIRGYAWEGCIVSRQWGFRLEEIDMEVHLWHGEEDTSTPPTQT